MICLNCHNNPATTHPRLGLLPCEQCLKKTYKRPGKAVEITTDEIKLGRKEYMDDVEQPHYKGELNKRWVEKYGVKAAKQRGFSEKEIKSAQYVYDGTGVRYYNDKT